MDNKSICNMNVYKFFEEIIELGHQLDKLSVSLSQLITEHKLQLLKFSNSIKVIEKHYHLSSHRK